MEYTNREQALQLLMEYTKNPNLLKHAFAVEASMRAYAQRFEADPDEWGVVGLLHDFDYEQYPTPEEHTIVGARILRDKGYPEHVVYAISAHADYNGLKRDRLMERVLFACDELSGFVTAVALVRPSKSVFDVDVKSVKKKLKDKAFARGVNREEVYKGAEELGVPLDEHIDFVINALKPVADVLEISGSE